MPYGVNNPVRYMAPDGNFIANMLLGAVTGATIGFVSSKSEVLKIQL